MEKLTMRRFYAEVFKSEKSIYEAKQVSGKRNKYLENEKSIDKTKLFGCRISHCGVS